MAAEPASAAGEKTGGIAGQVRALVSDLKDGAPAKVALAASQLRVLVGDSAGKVRFRMAVQLLSCDRPSFSMRAIFWVFRIVAYECTQITSVVLSHAPELGRLCSRPDSLRLL